MVWSGNHFCPGIVWYDHRSVSLRSVGRLLPGQQSSMVMFHSAEVLCMCHSPFCWKSCVEMMSEALVMFILEL